MRRELLAHHRSDRERSAPRKAHWKQIWSKNPQERLSKEIRRHTHVVDILHTRRSIIRLVGTLLAELHDELEEVTPALQSGIG